MFIPLNSTDVVTGESESTSFDTSATEQSSSNQAPEDSTRGQLWITEEGNNETNQTALEDNDLIANETTASHLQEQVTSTMTEGNLPSPRVRKQTRFYPDVE